MAAEYRSRRYLNAGERRWISGAVYGTVRLLRRQSALIADLGLPATGENFVAVWLAECQPEVTKQVDAERLAAAIARLPSADTPSEYLRLALAFPDPLAAELELLLGVEATAAAEALNKQAPTVLRVNRLKSDRHALVSRLQDAAPTHWSPWGIALGHRVNVAGQPGFDEGLFEIQEEASQLAAAIAAGTPGATVVEIGAGAGGKSLAMAALMGDLGRVFAFDTSDARLKELGRRAHRAGLRSIRPRLIATSDGGAWSHDGANGRLLARLAGCADAVLLDAPCSGTGVIRRSPDAKWREWTDVDLQSLQSHLLTQSAELVRPGGLLVYVTCAIERSQNEEIITVFLDSPAGAEFRTEPAVELLARALAVRDAEGAAPVSAGSRGAVDGPPLEFLAADTDPRYIRTWPHRHGMDAFFIAALRRHAVERPAGARAASAPGEAQEWVDCPAN